MRVMKLEEFSVLDPIEQQEIVLDHGVYLTSRLVDGFGVLLFQVGIFYVELFYPDSKEGSLIIKCFESTDELTPYLKKINITPLLC